MFFAFVWPSGEMFLSVTFTAQLGQTGQFHTPNGTPAASSWSTEQVWCNCCSHGYSLFTAAVHAWWQDLLGLALNGFAAGSALWGLPVQTRKSGFIYLNFSQTNPFPVQTSSSKYLPEPIQHVGCHWPKGVVSPRSSTRGWNQITTYISKNNDK